MDNFELKEKLIPTNTIELINEQCDKKIRKEQFYIGEGGSTSYTGSTQIEPGRTCFKCTHKV